MVLATASAFAHGVQVAYRVLPNGFIRVYVEHWHGAMTTGSLVGNGMSITTTYGSTSLTQNINPTGAINNTSVNNLPGGGSALTVLRACAGEANTYNNWAYYDFAPAACGIPISIRLNSGNTVVLQDGCGSLYPVTINATFTDNSGPVLTCPAPVANVACGAAGTNVNFAATAVDNCGVASITYSVPSGSFFPVGTTNVTATATDINGFTSQCTFPVRVQVVDNTAPVVSCPSNVSLNAQDGMCGAVYNYAIPYSDNCGTASITQLSGLGSGSVFPVGTTVNTFRIADPSGNFVNCSFSVTVADNQPPVASVQNVSVNIDANGNASVTAGQVNNNSSDNCSVASIAITAGRTSFTCADAGQSFPVTLTITDNAGLSSSAVSMVTVADPGSVCNKAPIAVCRPRTFAANANCQANPAAIAFDNGSSDPDGDVITFSVSPAGPYYNGTTNVVLTVTDSKGATSSCSTTVTVVDQTLPTMIPPPAVTVNAAYGACSATGFSLGTANATDNCGVVAITNDVTAPFPIGTTVVTWKAIDGAGNWNIGYQKVTVVNTTPPVIGAVNTITANNDMNACGAVVNVSTPVAASGCSINECGTDNIDSYTLGAVSGQSSRWIPWPYYGVSGNVSNAQSFSGSNSVAFANGQDQLYLLGNKNTGKWTVKWKMYVPAGRTAYFNTQHFETAGLEWGQQVQFASNGNGVLQAGGAFTMFTYPQGQWFDVEQYFDLDADATTLSVDGTAVKTWQFSRQANNSAGTKQLGGLDFFANTSNIGGVEPNLSAPSLFYVDDISLCGSNDVVVTGVRSDNLSLTDAYPVGNTTITWTATDGGGLTSTSTQVITVADNEAPVANCTASSYNKVVDNAGCTYIVKGTEFDITPSDNCGIASVINNYNNNSSLSNATFPVGSTNVTWTVTDIHGNTSTCSYNVIVTNALAVSVAGSSVLPQGVNPNTIYIGYTPASTLSLTASATGSGSNQYYYNWTVSNNLSIVGSNNAATVKVTATSANSSSPYTVSLVVTDAYGCVTSSSYNVNVTDVRCGNKNDKVLVCHSTGSAKNPWVQVCIAPSAVATHLANGSYLGSCMAAKGTTVEPIVKASALKVYPNPASGAFEVRLINFKPGTYQVNVIDITGKFVASRNVNTEYSTQDIRFDLRNNASGTYYIRVMNGKEVISTQVVIAR